MDCKIDIERELLAIVHNLPGGWRANGPALLGLVEPGTQASTLDRRLLHHTLIYDELVLGVEWECLGPAPPESSIELVLERTEDAFVRDEGGNWDPLALPVRASLPCGGLWFPLRYRLTGARAVAVTLRVRPEGAAAGGLRARIWALLLGDTGARFHAPICVPLAGGDEIGAAVDAVVASTALPSSAVSHEATEEEVEHGPE